MTTKKECPKCNGNGRIWHPVKKKLVECPKCWGSGWVK